MDQTTEAIVEEVTVEEKPAGPQEGAEPEAVDEVTALRQELETVKAQADEYLDGWQRARADMANLRKRLEREQAEFGKLANASLIVRLLPVLDDFERAFQTVPDNLRVLTWVDGVFLIWRKLQAILEAEGLQPIEAARQPFDPSVHEAVMQEETTDHEDGQVISELQRGYRLHERVLRPSMVKVARRVEPAEESQTRGS